MLSDIITENGLDLGIATTGNDSIIMSQLPPDQLAYFSASPFPDAIALLEGDDNVLNDNTGRIFYGNQGSLGFLSQPSNTPANPGNTLINALNLGSLSPRETLSFTEFIGVSDSSDIYQFTVDSNSDVNINLGGVTESARVQLIKDFNNNGAINEGDGDILASSLGSSSSNGNINRAIQAGTYYVQVLPSSSGNNTNYDLTISV